MARHAAPLLHKISMLPFRLCRRLHQAGFPQLCANAIPARSTHELDYDSTGRLQPHAFFVEKKVTRICRPGLHELLAECIKLKEDGDLHLEHLHDQWSAGLCSGPTCQDEGVPWQTGTTPEEALAKLWLRCKRPRPSG